MNFDECTKRLQELYNEIFNNENYKNENYKTLEVEFNEVFLNLLNASINEKKYFSGSPLNLFIVELKEQLENNEQDEIDFDEIENIKRVYLFQRNILASEKHHKQKNVFYYKSILNNENYNLLRSILRKRTEYLEKLLFKKGIEVIVTKPYTEFSRVNISFKKHINIMVENDNLKPIKTITKPKTNKSLLFDGKELNLSERFKIANKVLGIDTKIRTLNIQDLEKYQLLAYILGCDKDNARNLMNGSYKTKDRDLSTYFNDLGLNK